MAPEGLLTDAVASAAGDWDRAGRIPVEVPRRLGAAGVLCAEVPAEYGGLGLSGLDNGRLTAHAGTLCGSLRSLMTSQGMAAWVVQRFGSAAQRVGWLRRLTGGTLAAVAFSEATAGSDLAAMRTTVERSGDSVTVDGRKVWVTGAAYADVVLVFGRYANGAAVVVVPTAAPGVRVEPVPAPLGCRAAGHAAVILDRVRLPADHVLAPGVPLPLLTTMALTYGRLSVAWGCVGMLTACRTAAAGHAKRREQFGRRIADHQLVAGHLADLVVAEETARHVCEHASRCWDARTPDLVVAAVLAKQVAATNAARGAATAVQVLASAGAHDGEAVARAYRDAKLMEIIEGSTEIGQLILAEHALRSVS